ncbi:hypothetical protein [Streptomyces kronopolitis]
MTDAAIAVLDTTAEQGWSPTDASDTQQRIDVPAAALAQRGRPMADVLDQVPALTAAARDVPSAPLPPVPRHGTAAARQEEADGTAAYRAWRDTPRHRPPHPGPHDPPFRPEERP